MPHSSDFAAAQRLAAPLERMDAVQGRHDPMRTAAII